MNFHELKQTLEQNPDRALQLVFPSGDAIPEHFHVTEVGHVTKDFVDCGGTRRTNSSCVLQTLVAHDVEHRLSSTKLASILELAGAVLPDETVPVEIEYDQGTISLFVLNGIKIAADAIQLSLAAKHTACLAPDKCGLEDPPTPDTACDPAANC